MLNERTQRLLKVLVERYIADGQPVASKTLAAVSGLELSPASIRNMLADLEAMGLIASPHTSAGRVPTQRGYRLFVDRLITIQPLAAPMVQELRHNLQPDSPQRVLQAASQMLSELTQFAGVVMTPQRPDGAFRQIEFLRLSERRVLLILVTLEGDVRNHLFNTPRDYSGSELIEAANFLNQHYAGQALAGVVERMEQELTCLQGDISGLMTEAIRFGRESLSSDEVMVSGEGKLLCANDFGGDLQRLRELFDTFERKTELLQLLEQSRQAPGVNLFIGDESGVVTLDDCSVVIAPYRMGGQVVGTLGVVGPTRMAYERVIPIVDITARLVSSALNFND
ncbi:heat-inducible transcriptional repressor HrcA [Vogesella indigofera]|uniref:heat-inducible transcriptional repressor HrcA n=1 Tax=Vogesella indigofera TaxID=45465 RepID=UPI00234ED315|nr:heat-inducible transcriptional repressor HrcA [Vogesella indigofera]MDC7698612.1 heat-inducible transcriptional repressor HrcA [Vogesella indigofera]